MDEMKISRAVQAVQQYAKYWVEQQGSFIETARRGVLQLHVPGGESSLQWCWPDETVILQDMPVMEALNRTAREGKGLVINSQKSLGTSNGTSNAIFIGYPLTTDNGCELTALYEIEPVDEAQLHRAMHQLQWGMTWLAKYGPTQPGQPHTMEDYREGRSSQILATMGAALEQATCREMAISLTTGFQQLLACDRVAIGLMEKGRISLPALSGRSFSEQRMNINRAMQEALEECADQVQPVTLPALGDSPLHVNRALQSLKDTLGCDSLLTVPFVDSQGEAYGAMLVETAADQPVDTTTLGFCEGLAKIAGPLLREQRQRELPLVKRLFLAGHRVFFRPVVTGTFGQTAVTIALTCFFLAAFFIRGDFLITAQSTLSGTSQRAIIAPFSGYINLAQKSAGDHVEKDELLAAMDITELTLEELTWASKMNQAELEYRKAVAENRTASARIVAEQKRQAEIQLSLLALQRERTQITAPLSGLLVKGDLSQSIGAPVERGQVLFEIVPENEFRILLEVDEKDIAYIRREHTGTAILNALPKERLLFTIVKVTPVSTASGGKNTFRVEGRLQSPSQHLRPGMNGYGKILVDRRPYLWIWTRALREKIGLWLWSFGL